MTYINELISEPFSSPVECLLRTFTQSLQSAKHIKQKPSFSCLSVHPIPFSSTEYQKAVLCLSSELRFNISADGVANLVPNTDSQPCTICNCINWSNRCTLDKESKIITYNKTISANGLYNYTLLIHTTFILFICSSM